MERRDRLSAKPRPGPPGSSRVRRLDAAMKEIIEGLDRIEPMIERLLQLHSSTLGPAARDPQVAVVPVTDLGALFAQ